MWPPQTWMHLTDTDYALFCFDKEFIMKNLMEYPWFRKWVFSKSLCVSSCSQLKCALKDTAL